MYWNYRIVDVTDDRDDGQYLEVREVFYDSKDRPMGHTPATIGGENLVEIVRMIKRISHDLQKFPVVLNTNDFTGDMSE